MTYSMRVRAVVFLVPAAALIVACGARRPVLYPNAHAKQVGPAQQQRDIAACEEFAKTASKSGMAAEGARRTVVGGAVGSASGAVGGAIYGNAGSGAAAGAAGGAVAGLLSWMFHPKQPDPAYVGFVNTCLAERGYQVAGWQ